MKDFKTSLRVLLFLSFTLTLISSTSTKAQDMALAKELITQGQYSQALKELQKMPDSFGDRNTLLGNCYMQLGEWNKAAKAYKALLHIDSSNQIALHQLATIAIKRNNLSVACEYYAQLIQLDKSNGFYDAQMGKLLVKRNRPDSALFHFKSALKKNPQNQQVIGGLAKIHIDKEQYGEADSLLQVGLQLDSLNSNLRLLMAQSAFYQLDYEKTLHALSFISKADTSFNVAYLAGLSYFQLEKPQQAIPYLRVATKYNPKARLLHYYLAMACKDAGFYDEAAVEFKKTIKLASSPNLPHFYAELADAYEKSGKRGEAIKMYKEAYDKSGKQILLYKLARNYDAYYKDKLVAMRYYEKYLATADSAHKPYLDYAQYRIEAIKEKRHFSHDSL